MSRTVILSVEAAYVIVTDGPGPLGESQGRHGVQAAHPAPPWVLADHVARLLHVTVEAYRSSPVVPSAEGGCTRPTRPQRPGVPGSSDKTRTLERLAYRYAGWERIRPRKAPVKNFDEPPDPAAPIPDPRETVDRMRVEIVGDQQRMAEQLRDSFKPLASMSDELREALVGSSRERQETLKAAMAGLARVELPKVDWPLESVRIPRIDLTEVLTTRVAPPALDLPKPVRSIVDIRLEALAKQLEVETETLNRLVDVAQKQTEALLALDDAMEARHAESESAADARAARADNRAAWGVTFAGLAALLIVIEFFVR